MQHDGTRGGRVRRQECEMWDVGRGTWDVRQVVTIRERRTTEQGAWDHVVGEGTKKMRCYPERSKRVGHLIRARPGS